MTRPRICACYIARNEERDLPKSLRSLVDCVDHVVVVDTGSSDRTEVVAMATIDKPTTCVRWLDASEPDPTRPGEYRLTNFAKARNHALDLAEATGCDFTLWIDADDVVETPQAIRRATFLPEAIFGIWIELDRSGIRQLHHRLFPTAWRLRFRGWVHEFLVIPDERPVCVLNDACIRHDSTPHPTSGEDSNARNLRILTAQYAAEPDARTAFYLANTHKDGGRWREAIPWYHRRLSYGDAFRDEYLFALLYLARCLRLDGQIEGARNAALHGIGIAPDWQEFRMELAHVEYNAKRYAQAIDEASKAVKQPAAHTMLWREKQAYSDAPARLISWCHEHLGNTDQAIVWAELAADLIGADDAEWNLRRRRLRAQRLAAVNQPQAPAVVTGVKPMIALHRPGAIGDIIMTLNLLPAFREANPDAQIHYYCARALAQPDALGSLILAAGADAVMASEDLPSWRKQYARVVDLVGYPLAEGYPDKPMRRHLLEYFGAELGLDTAHWTGLPQIMLPKPARPACVAGNKAYATLQTVAGWSRYKEWPEQRWREVFSSAGLPDDLAVVSVMQEITPKLRDAIALVANARLHVGIDSFANHLTNYLWADEHGARRVPGVILWGSTQWEAAGYPDNVNIAHRPQCGPCFREDPKVSRMPRGPCVNRVMIETGAEVHRCMADISVDEVVAAVRAAWEDA